MFYFSIKKLRSLDTQLKHLDHLETCKFQLKMMKLKNVVTVVKFTTFLLLNH